MDTKRALGRAGIILLLLLLAGAMCACSVGGDREEPIEYVIGVSQANMREPWWLVLEEELREEAEKYPNVHLVFSDASNDPEKQIEDISRLESYGIDLLIVSPADSEKLTPAIEQTHENIPVIVLDQGVNGFGYTLFIGPDNRLVGRQAGEAVCALSSDGLHVAELSGNLHSGSNRDRHNGFMDAVGSRENIQVTTLNVEKESRDHAQDVLQEWLKQNRDVDVVFAHNDYMALGAYLALKEAGLEQVRIIGIDGFSGENGGLGLVANGSIDVSITCPTGGREAIQNAMDILNEVSGVPKQIILRSHTITRDNLAEYLEEVNHPQTMDVKTVSAGYVQIVNEGGWRLANNNSIQQAAKAAGIDLETIDSDQSQEKQIEAVRQFIAEGKDVIIISPVVADGWDEVLTEAKRAGIPVLLSDREINTAKPNLYHSYIGADFTEEGRRAMRWLAENRETGSSAEILELEGTPGAAPTIGRSKGFREVMRSCHSCAVVSSLEGDYTFEGGYLAVQDYLKTNGAVFNVIFSHNDDMALGAVKALEEAGLEPGIDVKIISVDGTAPALEALRKGKMNCVVECSPLLGPQLMKAIRDLCAGRELPLRIITDEVVFTRDSPEKWFENRTY